MKLVLIGCLDNVWLVLMPIIELKNLVANVNLDLAIIMDLKLIRYVKNINNTKSINILNINGK